MSVWETLGIALAGGSVGSAITLIAGLPEQVRHNNRRAREYDEDLAQWVSDECVNLDRELTGFKNARSAGGAQYDGADLRGIAHIKEDYLHRYRDQQRGAEGKLQALRDSEGYRHRLWRWLGRTGPLPELTTPAKAEPILGGWRGEVRVQGVGKAPVSDPTRRPLDPWALHKFSEVTPGNDPPQRERTE